LTGLISVQAGAVTALVEGGGASGSMSLSLNLPIMIDATTRGKLVNASTEQKVAAVYALIEGTEYYGIKGNASDQAVKALWDDAIAGNLIASQIILSADQINLAGKTVFTSQKTQTVANAAQTAAEATAAADATAKANAAQTAVAQKFGYASWDAMAAAASLRETIIDGGYIRTSLVRADNAWFQNIQVTGEFIGRVDGKLSRTEVTATSVADLRLALYNTISEQWYVEKKIDASGFVVVQTKTRKALIEIYAIENHGLGMFFLFGRPLVILDEGDENMHTYSIGTSPGFTHPQNPMIANYRSEIWIQGSEDDYSSNYYNDYTLINRPSLDYQYYIQDCIKIEKAMIYF
jgi:predicted nucleic acid-binding protein